MNLTLPTVSVTPGPEYATENNTAFTTIDSHNHTSGRGAQVPTLGININANLSFAGYYALQLGNARFINQGSPLGTASDLNCVYFSGGNLYANDSAGNQIQMTAGGAVNTAAGNINGMGATTASVTYTVGNTTFTFWSNNLVSATLDGGAVTIREPGVVSPNGVTLFSPTSLAASYDLTLPTALAATNNAIVLSSNAGVLSYLSLGAAAALAKVNSAGTALGYLTKGSAYQVLQVNSGGTDLTYASVSRNNLAAVGQQVSTSCSNFSTASSTYVAVTNLSVTITTTGRPVIITIMPDGSNAGGAFGGTIATIGSTTGSSNIAYLRDTTYIAEYTYSTATNAAALMSPGIFVDVVAAGTYTYTVKTRNNSGGSAQVFYWKLAAYEL